MRYYLLTFVELSLLQVVPTFDFEAESFDRTVDLELTRFT